MAVVEAAAPPAAAGTAVPWEVRLGVALRLPPLAWGGLVALVLIAGALVFRFAMERAAVEPIPGLPDLGFATRVALVASATIGYTFGIWRWLGVAICRDLKLLGLEQRPLDPRRDELLIHAAPRELVRRSRLAGGVGVLVFVAFIEGPNSLAGGPFGAPWVSLHSLSYMLFLGVLFFWLGGRAAYFSVATSGGAGDNLRKLPIDLVDLGPLYVVGRMALRGSLIWIIGLSIASLAFVNPELRFAESLVVAIPMLLLTLAIATATLLLPVRGIHRRIGATKREELERVAAAIRGDRDALVGSRLADQAETISLADLIAYRGLVANVPEWPFDAAVLRRLGLYLLIPILSWTGGALVERFVGLALD